MEKLLKNEYSVRKLEKIVKDLTEAKPIKPQNTKRKSVHVVKVEEKLRNLFGTKVTVRTKNEGGSIEVEFYSPEDLNRLLEIFDHLE